MSSYKIKILKNIRRKKELRNHLVQKPSRRPGLQVGRSPCGSRGSRTARPLLPKPGVLDAALGWLPGRGGTSCKKPRSPTLTLWLEPGDPRAEHPRQSWGVFLVRRGAGTTWPVTRSEMHTDSKPGPGPAPRPGRCFRHRAELLSPGFAA